MVEKSSPGLPYRSRPYHSDDNAHVEQNELTMSIPGYGRLEDPQLVALISTLYRRGVGAVAELLLPCLKLEKKGEIVQPLCKRYEPPKTAYHRLCAPGMLSLKARRALRDRYESLDPFALKEELESKLKQILKTTKSNGGMLV